MYSLVTRLPTTEAYARAAAKAVADALNAVLRKNDIAVLSVPGGSTARAVLPELMTFELPWPRITVTLADERWVPATHPDSNEALVRLLLGGKAEARNIRGLYDGTPDARAALPALIARWPKPDVILLGMGEDGHIASLFPDDAANFSGEMLAATERADHTRVTLTPKVISQASALIIAFTGEAKSKTFERALKDGAEGELPVRHALRRNARVFIGP